MEQAHAEAVRQFCAQGLHKTENRTGVLIFASEAEHYAEMIADAGINAKVKQEVWDDAVAVLIAGDRRRPRGRRLHCCDRALRRGAGAAFPARRAQPRTNCRTS